MEIIVKQTSDTQTAFAIAQKLTEYFNSEGLAAIQKNITHHKLFGAYIENQMVGFIAYKELNNQAVELTWMGTEPHHQGKGVGTSLVQESLNELRKHYKICEVKTLAETQPDEGYAKTRKFYIKLGFIPLEIIHPYPGWGEKNPCQIFVKCLL